MIPAASGKSKTYPDHINKIMITGLSAEPVFSDKQPIKSESIIELR